MKFTATECFRIRPGIRSWGPIIRHYINKYSAFIGSQGQVVCLCWSRWSVRYLMSVLRVYVHVHCWLIQDNMCRSCRVVNVTWTDIIWLIFVRHLLYHTVRKFRWISRFSEASIRFSLMDGSVKGATTVLSVMNMPGKDEEQ